MPKSKTKKTVKAVESVAVVANPNTEQVFASREDLKQFIHDIHNFLRNSAAGYGQTGLKIFSVFYGLKLINSYLNDLLNKPEVERGLTIEQINFLKFDKLFERANKPEDITSYIVEDVLNTLFDLKTNKEHPYHNFGVYIFYEIPRDLKPNVWKELIKRINKIPVGYQEGKTVNLSGKLWEYFVGRDKSAISELGAYFTDRPLTEYLIKKIDPQLDENGDIQPYIDCYGGSGGFTLGYATFLTEKYNNIDWKINVDNIYHFDMEETVVNMTALEIFAITGYFPKKGQNYVRGNSFQSELIGNNGLQYYFYIFSNPPYGGDDANKGLKEIKRSKLIAKLKKTSNKSKALTLQLQRLKAEQKAYEIEQKKFKVNYDNCSPRIRAFANKFNIKDILNDKEACSLAQFMDLVAPNGTCCLVLKEGVFFDNSYSRLREVLIKNFNVTHVISIGQKEFENTQTKTSAIIFHNNGSTKNITFSEIKVLKEPEDVFIIDEFGEMQITKIKDALFEDCVKEEYICGASFQQICAPTIVKGKKRYDYSLNFKNYMEYNISCPPNFKVDTLNNYLTFSKPKVKRPASFANDEGQYNFYTSSEKIKRCTELDYNDETLKLIFGDGGHGSLFMDTKFSCSDHNIICTTNNTLKTQYIYHYIKNNWNEFIFRMFNGSIIGNVGTEKLKTFKVPIPLDINTLKTQLESLYDLHLQISNITQSIPDKEKHICGLIKRLTDEGKKGVDYDEYTLEQVCKFKTGVKFTMSNHYIKNGNHGYIRIQNLQDNNNDMLYVDEFGYESAQNCLVKQGDILLSDVSDRTFVKITPQEWHNYVHYGSVIKCFNFKINEKYLYYFLLSDDFNNQKNNKEKGSIQKHLTLEILNNIKIRVLKPHIMAQHNIQQLFDEVDNLKTVLETSQQEYKKHMNELFKDFTDEYIVSTSTNNNEDATSSLDSNILLNSSSINVNIEDDIIDGSSPIKLTQAIKNKKSKQTVNPIETPKNIKRTVQKNIVNQPPVISLQVEEVPTTIPKKKNVKKRH